MKTDKLVHVIPHDFEAINYCTDLIDEGYILLSIQHSHESNWSVYHFRKTPFTWLMTKFSKKI